MFSNCHWDYKKYNVLWQKISNKYNFCDILVVTVVLFIINTTYNSDKFEKMSQVLIRIE